MPLYLEVLSEEHKAVLNANQSELVSIYAIRSLLCKSVAVSNETVSAKSTKYSAKNESPSGFPIGAVPRRLFFTALQ
jgi:hypothetical protein